MTFQDFFSDQSDLYASARPRYPEALFQFIASVAPNTLRAWDCGTGNGQAAVALAHRFDSVSASDPSPQQIANALPHPRVTYSIQQAETTDYPDAAFDAVCVAQALHWFDFTPFFQEVKRVLKPQGVFAAWGYDWFRVSPAFDQTFDRVVLQVIEKDWVPQNKILWNGYRNVDLPFPIIPTPSFSIRANWTFFQLLAYVHTWSAIRRCIARLGNEFFTEAEMALVNQWGSPETIREVVMPLHLLAGRYSRT